MPEKPHKAKGSKKNRKIGRHNRRPSGLLQPARTARNKAKRMFRCERKSGRPLKWDGASQAALNELYILRSKAAARFIMGTR